jgi:hypothetical protein
LLREAAGDVGSAPETNAGVIAACFDEDFRGVASRKGGGENAPAHWWECWWMCFAGSGSLGRKRARRTGAEEREEGDEAVRASGGGWGRVRSTVRTDTLTVSMDARRSRTRRERRRKRGGKGRKTTDDEQGKQLEKRDLQLREGVEVREEGGVWKWSKGGAEGSALPAEMKRRIEKEKHPSKACELAQTGSYVAAVAYTVAV